MRENKIVIEKLTTEYCRIHPSHFVAAPVNIIQIIEHFKGDMSFCKTLAGGGERMELGKERFVNRFLNEHHSQALYNTGYGMTEFAATVTTNLNQAHKDGSLGIPLCHCIVKIVNPDTLEELPYGETGEMCFQTPSVMMYYKDLPEETRKTMRRHADGVKESAVVVIQDSEVLHRIVAFLTLENIEQSNETAIKYLEKYCRNLLPEHSIPDRYKILINLPHTLSGKIDFQKLENMSKSDETCL